jgi:hypothetical protein
MLLLHFMLLHLLLTLPKFLEKYQASKDYHETRKAGAKAKPSRKKQTIENFFDDSDDKPHDMEKVADERVGYKLSYQQAEKLLLSKLRSCNAETCKGMKNCAINKHGVHTEINYSQIHAWATAMVRASCVSIK